MDSSEINIDSTQMTLFRIKHFVDSEVIDISNVIDTWDNDTKSRLIESVLVRIPLQSIMIGVELDTYTCFVISDQEMVKTLISFMNDDFELSGLVFLPKLNGVRFSQLDRALQRRFEETELLTHTIVGNVPRDVRENITARYRVK